MPSNILALGLYDLSIWKVLFGTPQAFAASKKKEDFYLEETTFCNSWEGLESLEYAEKVAAATTETIYTLTHTQDDCYSRCYNAYTRG